MPDLHVSRRSLFSPRLATVAAATVMLLALTSCGKGEAPKAAGGAHPAPEVGVVVATPTNVGLVTELPGRLEATRVAEVRARAAGILLQRVFQEGTDVKAGQVLYKIDPAPYAAAAQSADDDARFEHAARDRRGSDECDERDCRSAREQRDAACEDGGDDAARGDAAPARHQNRADADRGDKPGSERRQFGDWVWRTGWRQAKFGLAFPSDFARKASRSLFHTSGRGADLFCDAWNLWAASGVFILS